MSAPTVTGDGSGGWNVNVSGHAVNGAAAYVAGAFPAIDFQFTVNVSADGTVQMNGGEHDGFPSYEVWVYKPGEDPQQIYGYDQGADINLGRLIPLAPNVHVPKKEQ